MGGNYQQFLEALRYGKHPAFGVMEWDGQLKQTTVTVQFRRGSSDSPAEVRERAYYLLSRLTLAEQSAVRIEVILKDGLPIYAIIKPRTEAVKLSTARLQELADAE